MSRVYTNPKLIVRMRSIPQNIEYNTVDTPIGRSTIRYTRTLFDQIESHRQQENLDKNLFHLKIELESVARQ